MTRILITGKSGYVGTKVAEWLAARSYSVDRISIRDVDLSEIDLSVFDVIFHSAGIVPDGNQSEEIIYHVNRDLTFNLAKKAKAAGFKQFIFLSSMAVYGIVPCVSAGKGIVTSVTKCSPDNCYGKSKHEAELLLRSLNDDNFKVAIIRAPSIYGPGNLAYFQQYVYFMGRLPIQPMAFLNCKRSAIYIDSLAELIRLVIESKFEGIICPEDKSPLAAAEFVKYLSVACGKRAIFSKIFGLLLQLFFARHKVVNRIWGSVAYEAELSMVFDGKYQLYTAQEAIWLTTKGTKITNIDNIYHRGAHR